MYNLKIPSSLKKAFKSGDNRNIIMLLGAGAVIGAGAWFISNKSKEDKVEKEVAKAMAAGSYGLYPLPTARPAQTSADYPGASDAHPFLMETAPVASDSHPFGYGYMGPTPKIGGARSFNDYTMNDNSIPTPFLEINLPYAPYTSNTTKVPHPLANTIDKGAYVVTYTGWND